MVRTGQEAFGKLTSQVQETADTIASKWYASYYAEMDPKDAGSSKFNEQVETSLRQLDASAAAADKGVDGVVIVGSREKMEQGMRDRVNEQTVHLMENTADYGEKMKDMIGKGFPDDPEKQAKAMESLSTEMAAAVSKEYESIYQMDRKYGMLTDETKKQLDAVKIPGVSMKYSEYASAREEMLDQLEQSDLEDEDELYATAGLEDNQEIAERQTAAGVKSGVLGKETAERVTRDAKKVQPTGKDRGAEAESRLGTFVPEATQMSETYEME